MKPIDALRAASQPRQPTEAEIDIQNFAANMVKLADALSYHVPAISELVRKRGLNWFAANLPATIAENVPALIAATKALWEAGSDTPFPDFPDEAEAEAEAVKPIEPEPTPE